MELRNAYLKAGRVCVRLQNTFVSYNIICYLVSDSFANTVEKDTHMVSLSELESIFITLRLMDPDQVYHNKQVLVVFDVKILLGLIKQ